MSYSLVNDVIHTIYVWFYMDINTLSIVTVFLSTVFSVGLFSCYRYMFNGMVEGVNYVSIAMFFFGVSIVPIIFGYTQTSTAAVFFSNSLYVIAFCLLLTGVALVRCSRINIIWVSFAISVCAIFTFAYFTMITPSINARIEARSFFVSLICLITVFVNINGQTEDRNAPLFLLNFTLILNSVCMMVRLVWTYNESPIEDYFSISDMHKTLFIVMIFTIMVVSFTLFWILTERLITKVHDSSITDELTKLYNRKGLNEFIKNHLSIKRNTPLSIILFDIDKFKTINDTHGHESGDMVIEHFSEVLRDQCRNNDVCVRYGGDEFLVILPGASKEIAIKVADRIEKAVVLKPIKLIKYSVSCGLSEMNSSDDWNSLIKRVDDALYTAKSNGRNCAVQL